MIADQVKEQTMNETVTRPMTGQEYLAGWRDEREVLIPAGIAATSRQPGSPYAANRNGRL